MIQVLVPGDLLQVFLAVAVRPEDHVDTGDVLSQFDVVLVEAVPDLDDGVDLLDLAQMQDDRQGDPLRVNEP